MPPVVRALRGATTVDEDRPEHIGERVTTLVRTLFERNSLVPDDVVSMLFSATTDIHSTFPATVARLALGLEDVPLMNCQELEIDGALPRCIRVMAHVHTERARHELRHVFLEGASVLRPDLAQR
jgi:chorismate mutase